MLPQYGQDTAAVEIPTGQALPFMMANGDAFDKQAELIFAEFLICIFVVLLRVF